MVAVSEMTYENFTMDPVDNDDGPASGSLTGIVNDAETGDIIPDVLMTLAYHDTVRTELTDSNGRYTFTNVPICRCLKNISANKGGYDDMYQLTAVSMITHVNFSLNPVQRSSSDPGARNSINDTDGVHARANAEDTLIGLNGYHIAIPALIGIFIVFFMISTLMYAIKKKKRNRQIESKKYL